MSLHHRLFTLVMLFPLAALSAIPIQQSAFEKKNRYIDGGVFIGGYDRGVQDLLGLRGNFDKNSQVERLVLDLAPKTKNLGTERPGFFHVSVQKNQKRILVDLQNIAGDKISEEKLKKVFKNSHYYSDAKIYSDPVTKNLTLELLLKQAVKVEVFELAGVGQPGRLVIDVKL